MDPTPPSLPDPALIVLIGASGAGKSAWASARFARREIVSSDELRAIVGSGEHDLSATDDAFSLLDTIVAARAGRRLMTVIDTLGLDRGRRRGYLSVARAAGLPAVAMLFATDAAECRRRNRARDRPVPAAALGAQLRRMSDIPAELADEGWDARRATGWFGDAAGDGLQPARGRGGAGERIAVRRADRALSLGRRSGRLVALGGRSRRGGRLLRAGPDGPPDPDPAGGPGLGADSGALGNARAARRPADVAAARPAGQPGEPAFCRSSGEDRGDPRRAHRRSRLLRRGCRLVGSRACRVRAAVPRRRRASAAPFGDAGNDAGAVEHRHQGLSRLRRCPCRRRPATHGR